MTDPTVTLELGPDHSGREIQIVDDRVTLFGPAGATGPAAEERLDCLMIYLKTRPAFHHDQFSFPKISARLWSELVF